MTITEIKGPGEELDALVAEHVMGWKFGTGPRITEGKGVKFWQDPEENYESGSLGPPPYSTSIVMAWKIVERLVANSMEMRISHESKRWYCTIDDATRGGWNTDATWNHQWAWEHGETAPHAICNAVLKMVNADEWNTRQFN